MDKLSTILPTYYLPLYARFLKSTAIRCPPSYYVNNMGIHSNYVFIVNFLLSRQRGIVFGENYYHNKNRINKTEFTWMCMLPIYLESNI